MRGYKWHCCSWLLLPGTRPLPHPPLLTVIAGTTLSTPFLLDTGKQVLGLVFWFGL